MADNPNRAPHGTFMMEAISLSRQGMEQGAGGPFGAVVVKDGSVIGASYNRVLQTNDPTAHAEVEAIRAASRLLGRFDLSDCSLYTSCEPCPMCLGAIYWARLNVVYYANTRKDAAAIGFDDQLVYEELEKPLAARSISMRQLLCDEALLPFREWEEMAVKKRY